MKHTKPVLRNINTLATLVFALCTVGCRSQKPATNAGIMIVTQYPLTTTVKDGKEVTHNLIDSQAVFFHGDYIVRKLPAITDFSTNTKIANSEPYVVYKVGSQFGYYFTTEDDTSDGVKTDIDSLNRIYPISRAAIDYPKETSDYKKIEVVESNSGIIQKFCPQHDITDGNPDTIFYHFEKRFPDVDFSLSKKLDSLNKMKLVKMRMFFKAAFSADRKKELPYREIVFEIKHLQGGMPRTVLALLERVRKHYA
ncbi:hypothetical protein GWC95_00815 [Sediminibacterium roseum]|uniref:Lipoprotein n=1 Tax=Sediminibacterium roseum TaxID=1978412 RepID=A0ABW9ZPN4_9BACT|nr:hypothetical protein [Sediminibacterium roseum]NCI48442.1 hypothetical protein [Sediminibacterium roseum]